jgi:hypothetical protein
METRKGLIDESDREVTYVEMELEPLPNIQSPAISGSRIEEARRTGDVGACSMHKLQPRDWCMGFKMPEKRPRFLPLSTFRVLNRNFHFWRVLLTLGQDWFLM